MIFQQTTLMKYHALFVFLKKQQNLKLSSAANYMWRFKGLKNRFRINSVITLTSYFINSDCEYQLHIQLILQLLICI